MVGNDIMCSFGLCDMLSVLQVFGTINFFNEANDEKYTKKEFPFGDRNCYNGTTSYYAISGNCTICSRGYYNGYNDCRCNINNVFGIRIVCI